MVINLEWAQGAWLSIFLQPCSADLILRLNKWGVGPTSSKMLPNVDNIVILMIKPQIKLGKGINGGSETEGLWGVMNNEKVLGSMN